MSGDKLRYPQLDYSYDPELDILTIEGVRYSGKLFRAFAQTLALNTPFSIVDRGDGVITIKPWPTIAPATLS